ncbi:hypothetical protein [Gordonibacter sp.]|uniref:hypothetical protein n=1 Tax=Gordonibacter sp. TaxID=1968902 RepID=UPI001F863E7A|nr:hypothetical protein [Gordonibacter sp.]HIW75925.1 hypothetical protein [Candidatus Gordonibacter avicola]
MYMLTIKNRASEYKAVKELEKAGCLQNGLMPLVEIIQENFAYDNLIDPETGEFVKEDRPIKSGENKGKTRSFKIKDPSTKRNVTLEKIEEHFQSGHIFVDYFRCDAHKYNETTFKKCPLVLTLNTNIDAYLEKVRSIASHPTLIPVITIKNGTDKLSSQQLFIFAQELKELCQGRPIAIRIDDIEGYEDTLKSILSRKDYLIYDINETPAVSKIEEFEELNDLRIDATKILLCSPRKRRIRNGEYVDKCTIDNSHIVSHASYGFAGVGDYAGLRDSLPGGGSRGKGRALALLYNGWTNNFVAYVNEDVNLGPAGYQEVVERILADRSKLERTPGECIVLEAVSKEAEGGHFGGFPTWISYTVERYVQQLYLAHGGYNF